mmetsp:Transcript_32064/g.66951  ORF Transcript_32064/g.66951 Transcript_32064/m.66951 type:complete len:334 (-) Transcript_32064:164-1165(-)|eukprot:CAMPEP_0172465276 /NCGR_PEP_ID=MMETSP1065-20121228/53004_1 /TAXON_ID=265537 /ORGANISM="Amphiprora paludosa, Strain CCMP125" /LENGTH=333 /DNA_ID=CAMNT_0013221749 /DNA_START=85 /DNA_END=1086 /DNA_ORIENTATION=-
MSDIERVQRRAALTLDDSVLLQGFCSEDEAPEEETVDNGDSLSKGLTGVDDSSEQTIGTADSSMNRSSDSSTRPPSSPATKRRQREHRKVSRSVLIVGATGRTGTECALQLSVSQDAPTVYGLCIDFKEISEESMEMCRKHYEELIVGDATNAADIHRALLRSNADTVILCLGTGRNSKQTTLRTKSALSLVKVLVHPPFHHVKVICISSAGAGDCQMVNMGVGGIGCILPTRSIRSVACIIPSIGKNLQHDLQDHTGQEEVFFGNKTILARTTIVRPTVLTGDIGNTRRLSTFKNEENPPTFKTARKDLARWIVTESSYYIYQGRAVNVTSV